MKHLMRSIGYGSYGQNPFQPDFTVCKSEGGTANCPSEYVKEFSGFRRLGQTEDTMPKVSDNAAEVVATTGKAVKGLGWGLMLLGAFIVLQRLYG